MSTLRRKLAAASTIAALGGLSAYAVRSGDSHSKGSPAQQAAVEVRTQVIRRTVHVVHHERPRVRRRARAALPAVSRSMLAAPGGGAATGASSPVVRTRSSGGSSGSASPTPQAPVRTRTSGGGGGGRGGASAPLRTRTSAGGRGDGGGRRGERGDGGGGGGD